MTYPFKVLSLFDGISAAQVAINRIGIKDYIYYASEVDKYAITVTQANYPNTIQIGDVTKVNGKDYDGVDLLVAGSPCQGFSQAGLQTNFEHPQSRLFWHFVRILEECKPKYFLLENVKMKQEWRDVISKAVGCEPREINSALVSGQSRKRLYWTNIEKKHEIEDEGILLGDILEDGIATDEMTTKQGKSFCVTSRYDSAVAWNSIQRKQRSMILTKAWDKNFDKLIKDENARHESKTGNKFRFYSVQEIIDLRKKAKPENLLRPCKPREIKKDSLCHHVADATDFSSITRKRVYGVDGKSPTVSCSKEPKVLIVPKKGSLCHHVADATDISGHDYLKRVYAKTGKAPTLSTMQGGNTEPKVLIVPEQVRVRKHEVDIKKLQSVLRQHRLPIKEISEKLNIEKTTVEHWFRTDNCFSIPDSKIWFDLKKLLNIQTDEFDSAITEFEIRDGRYDMADRVHNPNYKSPTIVSSNIPKVLLPSKEVQECIDKGMKNVAFTETRTEEAKQLRKEHMAKYKKDFSPRRAKVLQPRKDDKMNCITTSMTKEHTLIDNNYYYRKLSCVELERLQTFDDNYTDHISKTQRCKALGNSFTVRIIEEILKDM